MWQRSRPRTAALGPSGRCTQRAPGDATAGRRLEWTGCAAAPVHSRPRPSLARWPRVLRLVAPTGVVSKHVHRNGPGNDARYDSTDAAEPPQGPVFAGFFRPHRAGLFWLRRMFDRRAVGGPRTSAASEKRPSGTQVNGRLTVRRGGATRSVPPGPTNPVQDTTP